MKTNNEKLTTLLELKFPEKEIGIKENIVTSPGLKDKTLYYVTIWYSEPGKELFASSLNNINIDEAYEELIEMLTGFESELFRKRVTQTNFEILKEVLAC